MSVFRSLYAVPDEPSESGRDPELLPHDRDAERALLGCVMMAPYGLAEARTVVGPEDFYVPAHEAVFRAACALADAGAPVQPVTLAAELDRRGELHRCGGAAYLHELAASGLTAANAGYFADVVAGHAHARRVMVAALRIHQAARSGDLAAARRLRDTDLTAALDVSAARRLGFDADPVPLESGGVVPSFPVRCLPGWVGEMVAVVAEETQTPPDLAATLALACLSAAAGGFVRVRPRVGWREPVNLYTAVAMPPGSRKSAVFRHMTTPLADALGVLAEQVAPARREALIRQQVARQAAEALTAKAARAESAEERQALAADAARAANEAAEVTVPADPMILADNITPEAAASALAVRGGRLAVVSAEGDVFDIMAGRYSSGVPVLDVWLKGHAGDPIRVDRKGRDPEVVTDPALTIGVCIQPSVLADIAAKPAVRGRGLLARFLYSVPASLLGARNPCPAPMPPGVAEAYAANLRALVFTLHGLSDPVEVVLTAEAGRMLDALAADLEPRLGPDGRFGHLTDWAAKSLGTTVRLAGLLHVAEHLRDGFRQPIGPLTLAAAAELTEYFAAHALAAFGAMRADPHREAAAYVLAHLGRTATARTSRRDLFSKLPRARFPKATDLDPALALLEHHGWIRPEPTATTPGRGRPPSPTYLVHPAAYAVAAAESAETAVAP